MSGVVVWLTGLPSSGKSTLARAIAAASEEPALVLDGDEVREALVPRHGYDPDARAAFYETLGRLAALAARQGLCVLVPATASLRAYRERARALAPAFVEVFVDTPPAECEARDAKGLYRDPVARARLPGLGAPFEPPLAPDLVVRPTDTDAAARVLGLVRAR